MFLTFLSFFFSSLYSIIETLFRIEDLLMTLQKANVKLPPSFDIHYFCSGLEIIIETEHYQLIQKLLSIVYNYADLFVGNNRKTLFADLFIKKYFFKLFLHWDELIRHYFQQILIFRVLFCLRNRESSSNNENDKAFS